MYLLQIQISLFFMSENPRNLGPKCSIRAILTPTIALEIMVLLLSQNMALSMLYQLPVLNFAKSRARQFFSNLLQEFLRGAMYFESSLNCDLIIIFIRKSLWIFKV